MRVGVICGGRSAEHAISLSSARSVVEALLGNGHQVEVVYITPHGEWQRAASTALLEGDLDRTHRLDQTRTGTAAGPPTDSADSAADGLTLVHRDGSTQLVRIGSGASLATVDVVFPVLHGPHGEDGAVQGMLRSADVPFIGADVLGSAVAMDKDVAKRLLQQAGIAVARGRSLDSSPDPDVCAAIVDELGLPLFVKPANLGSSVGVSKVTQRDALAAAVELALGYDDKVVVEEAIVGRELEVSVLGNRERRASVVGEVVTSTTHEFYDYEAKYLDDDGAQLIIPAHLPDDVAERVRELACEACRVLCVDGMARADFFLPANGEPVVNELNTIPGFTSISMYAKLWEASGLSFGSLLEELASLAAERHGRQAGRRIDHRDTP